MGGGYSPFNANNPGGSANFDKRFTANFVTATPMTQSFQRLFDVVFTVNNSAADGTYFINGVNPTVGPPGASGVTVNTDSSYGFQIVNGSIQVVPEPSSAALVGLFAAGLGFYRRRRQ